MDESETLLHSLWASMVEDQNSNENDVVRRGFEEKISEPDFVSGVQLSLWDNVFGPRVMKLWHNAEQIPADAQISVARHTLNDEVCRPDDLNMAEPKFHVVPELGYVVASTIFQSLHNRSLTRFALSLLVKRESLTRYMVIHRVVEGRMNHLVSRLKILLNNNTKKNVDDVLAVFSTFLKPFFANIDELFNSGLPPVPLSATAFGNEKHDLSPEFLSLAITSHLSTHGVSVVIGSSADSINLMINTLALFTTDTERARSRRFTVEKNNYEPDLCLQGLLEVEPQPQDIVLSIHPSTVINLDARTVHQTLVYHEYEMLRKMFFESQLRALEGSAGSSKWEIRELYKPFKNDSDIVAKLVSRAYSVENLDLREAFIHHSFRLLVRQCVLVIKYVEALKSSDRPKLVGENPQRLLKGLTLSKEDLGILLGLAEKMCPGTYRDLYGDPTIQEAQLQHLLDSFM